MSELTTARRRRRPPPRARLRTVARWMVTFLGFPLGGFAADLLVGPVDSLGPRPPRRPAHRRDPRRRAGLGLSAATGPSPVRWIAATAARPDGRARRRRGGRRLRDRPGRLARPGGRLRARRRRRPGRGAAARARPASPSPGRPPSPPSGPSAGRSPPPPASRSTSSSPSSAPAAPSSSPPSPPSCPHPRQPRKASAVMTRHVVFGTGQVGRLVVEQLVAPRRRRRRRQPQRPGPTSRGAACVAGDATDPAFTTRVAAGADVVYFCLNAMNYARWAEEFPPLQRAVLAGAAGRRRPPRRARQPLRLRPDRRPATSSRPCRPDPPPPRPPPGPR